MTKTKSTAKNTPAADRLEHMRQAVNAATAEAGAGLRAGPFRALPISSPAI